MSDVRLLLRVCNSTYRPKDKVQYSSARANPKQGIGTTKDMYWVNKQQPNWVILLIF